MLNRTLIPFKLLVLALLVLPPALLTQNLFAEEWRTPDSTVVQPQDLAGFLDSLADQSLPEGENFTPAPENKVVYCFYQPCPTGQRCWYCRNNWVCVYEYPDPDQVPSGCTGGTQ